MRGVGPYRRYCDEPFSLSRAAPRSHKSGFLDGAVGRAAAVGVFQGGASGGGAAVTVFRQVRRGAKANPHGSWGFGPVLGQGC